MISIARSVNRCTSIELSSIFRMYSPSPLLIRNISTSGLKHLNTFTFFSPVCTKQTLLGCQKNIPFLRAFSSPLIRTLLTQSVASPGRSISFPLKQKPFMCTIQLFHTQRAWAAKIGTGIKGERGIKGSPDKNTSGLIYIVAIFVLMLGGAYAGVPLYKVFCQATGLGGQAVSKGHDTAKIESMKKVDRQIRVRFNADVASSMRWNFKPQQSEVTVLPGETALAFYTARNPTDKPIIGISTYNVLPYDAGQYFNKIQCFCFEEQRLNPKEQVDMPVFFFIDPEFAEDPKLEHIDTITLSYTFFEAVEGLTLPLPGYPQPHDPVPAAAAS